MISKVSFDKSNSIQKLESVCMSPAIKANPSASYKDFASPFTSSVQSPVFSVWKFTNIVRLVLKNWLSVSLGTLITYAAPVQVVVKGVSIQSLPMFIFVTIIVYC